VTAARPRRPRRRIVPLALAGLVVGPVVGWAAYAGVTWLRFGREPAHGGADPLMERYMPRYDIAEVHRTSVAAPAEVTLAAAREMDLNHSPVVCGIFHACELMLRAEPPPRPAHLPLVTELLSIGWGVHEEVPGRQIVFGAVTQPWEANVVFRALPPERFASFDSAGYVKIVVTFAADSLGLQSSRFRTETRAVATDPASRARFRRYWSVFSPGILLIRWQSLSLVRREAERRAAAQHIAR
jgi:hypothetical protein